MKGETTLNTLADLVEKARKGFGILATGSSAPITRDVANGVPVVHTFHEAVIADPPGRAEPTVDGVLGTPRAAAATVPLHVVKRNGGRPTENRAPAAPVNEQITTAEMLLLSQAPEAVNTERIGDLMVMRNLIRPEQRDMALERQNASGHLFGRVALDMQLVTVSQLQQVIDEQNGNKRPTTRAVLARLGMAEHAIRATLARAKEFGHPLPQIMRDWGGLSQEAVAKAIAIEHGIEYFPFTEIDNIPISTLRAFDIAVDDFSGYVPIGYKGGVAGKRGEIVLLISHPKDMSAATSEFKAHRCEFLVASPTSIQVVYRRYFAQTATKFEEMYQQYKKAVGEQEDVSHSTIFLDLLMALLRHACYCGASDIQMFPTHDVAIIKLRIDGVWDIFKVIPTELLDSLFGVMRNNMFGNNVQDDGLRTGFTDTSLQLNSDQDEGMAALRKAYGDIVERYVFRVEVGNSIQKRTLTIRINDKESTTADVRQLGLDPRTLDRLNAYVRTKSGVFLLVGPTGSGKTTTLHALLHTVDAITESVQTVENPVEYTRGLWMQYQVEAGSKDEGQVWLDYLKGILRNAPDKLLFGEIRDAGTAIGCFMAANTGHLVFSTLHANGAPEAVARLADLEIGRERLSTELLGVLAQRLVRKLCNACKVPDERPETTTLLTPHRTKSLHHVSQLSLFRARTGGCPNCGHTGFRGRRMIYELFHVGKKVRNLLEENAPISELRAEGIITGSMRDSGFRLVAEGVTSLDELATHIDLEY